MEKAGEQCGKTSLPVLLVCEGKAIHNNLELIGWDLKTLNETIRKHGAKTLKQVGVMTVDGNGKVYYQNENQKYETFNIKFKEGLNW